MNNWNFGKILEYKKRYFFLPPFEMYGQ